MFRTLFSLLIPFIFVPLITVSNYMSLCWFPPLANTHKSCWSVLKFWLHWYLWFPSTWRKCLTPQLPLCKILGMF